jgi:hypothetical protein
MNVGVAYVYSVRAYALPEYARVAGGGPRRGRVPPALRENRAWCLNGEWAQPIALGLLVQGKL